jgi:hypothetical protein
MRHFLFDPLQERDGTENLSDRCGMNPNGFFKGRRFKKPQPFGQCFSKSLLDEAPEENIGTCKNEKKGQQDIVEVVDH